MLPLRVRRIERVRVHVDLSILTSLVATLDTARASHEITSVSVA